MLFATHMNERACHCLKPVRNSTVFVSIPIFFIHIILLIFTYLLMMQLEKNKKNGQRVKNEYW